MAEHWNDKRRTGQRIDPRYKKEWPRIAIDLERRLRQGHREYGDGSFSRPMSSLLEEVREEQLDAMLWNFIAVVRVDEMIERVKKLEGLVEEEEE